MRHPFPTEIGGPVHPRDGRLKTFAMIEAYLDETGIEKGAVHCIIAGYFGGRGQWNKFGRDWRKALSDKDVPLEEFHALDLIKRHKFFHGWSDAKQESLLRGLATAATSYKIHPVSIALVVKDFNHFSLEQRRFFTGALLQPGNPGKLAKGGSGCPNKPYFSPFLRCIKRVAGYAPVGGKANFFFGLDRPFGNYAAAVYKFLKDHALDDPKDAAYREVLGAISFPVAKATPELQAADMLAFLTKEHVAEHGPHGLHAEPQGWLREFLRNTRMPEDHTLLDKRFFLDMLQQTYERSGDWDQQRNVLRLSDFEPASAFVPEDEDELPSF